MRYRPSRMTSVFILVDALGWELVRDRPFLEDLLPYRKPLATVFGFSSAAIPSILTGLLPQAHGHWNLYFYSPRTSPFRWARPLRRLPSAWINHRVPRKIISILGRLASRSHGYFSIYGIPVELLPFFDICEKNNIYEPGGLKPNRSVFDELEERRIPYRLYCYHHYSDRAAIARMKTDLEARVARFYFLYLSELDAFLHQNLHRPESVHRELEQYAAAIESLFYAARMHDGETAFYVFSDHGMTPVRESFDLMSDIRTLNWREPDDYVALYDSTMARFWFFREACRRDITERLMCLPVGRLVSAEDRQRWGIGFSDQRFGELIFVMRPGCVIHPSYMGGNRWRGMHGFAPEEPTSLAVLLASRRPPVPVDHICQIYDLMRHEAGLSA
jgi:predicted AlkP superfamily pyrophosphatase or phosphodiesterase